MSNGQLLSFPSMQAGQQAAYNQILKAATGQSPYYDPNASIASAVQTYTGNGPNAVQNVAAASGLDLSQPLSSLAPGTNPNQGFWSALWQNLPQYLTNIKGIASAETPLPGKAGAAAFANTAATGNPQGTTNATWSTLFSSRAAFAIIGAIFIAGAVLMLSVSGIEEAINSDAGQSVKKAAGAVASVAA